jgi:hypothetical protein
MVPNGKSLSVLLHDASLEDIDYVMALERKPENAPQGFAVLRGINDPDGCRQLQRIVIDAKGRGVRPRRSCFHSAWPGTRLIERPSSTRLLCPNAIPVRCNRASPWPRICPYPGDV